MLLMTKGREPMVLGAVSLNVLQRVRLDSPTPPPLSSPATGDFPTFLRLPITAWVRYAEDVHLCASAG